MKVTIFGMGYVGCVTSACLASCGHHVTGVDLDQNKIDLINSGHSPLIEPGLEDLIGKGVSSGRLQARREVEDLGDVSIICVGTPSNSNGSLCLDHVQRVVSHLGDKLRERSAYHVVNVRSTVIPGTVENIIIPLLAERSGKTPGKDFGVCMNPEFLRETTAVQDFHNPPFTVIGGLDERSINTVGKLYESLAAPLEKTPIAVAEMIKYSCNAFHALKVCFANEVGVLSKSLGIDSHKVMEVFCKDGKLNLSPYYLKPGFAFGGSCLPKDLRAILHLARQQDLDFPVLNSLLESNRRHLDHAFNLVRKTGKKRVGVLGLSFKAGTDDLRESPIVILIEQLLGKGYQLKVYDEEVSLSQLIGSNRRYIEATIPHISSLLVAKAADVLKDCDIVIVSKRNKEFQAVVNQVPPGVTVIDLVRIIEPSQAPSSYEGICW
ncbi:MAG TPA: UDP-glucose/GDP-mannose dehydrogenase family protein [Verrucomicrobiae bacterium]|jgi:GDP-mannose 6-dehydrogenase|nr:UDP-glucose/GDP-mannose dehydrogenase family protein [Verrucomicrobiae bacterium]